MDKRKKASAGEGAVPTLKALDLAHHLSSYVELDEERMPDPKSGEIESFRSTVWMGIGSKREMHVGPRTKGEMKK
ncbi:hypothetical protein SETIT_8G046400v2 [Setaria italica]|uniref:Uncharacterized protein n=1 Tax=Setaria italica TaxID=4555 RepID=A0A368S442_SETIT|nr:hypothetical protein SETIT_8G046400v2 [Setaria italica]